VGDATSLRPGIRLEEKCRDEPCQPTPMRPWRQDVARHARSVGVIGFGGPGVAGLAAFLPSRILWTVFFG